MDQVPGRTTGEAVCTRREEVRYEMALVAQVDDARQRVHQLRDESGPGRTVDEAILRAHMHALVAARDRLAQWRAG